MPRAGLAACLTLLLAAAWGQGKGNGVEVLAVSPKLQDSTPGRILSLNFRVTNKTDREEEFIETLKLPSGWQPLLPISSFFLHARESQVRIIALSVPRLATAGRQDITYAVRSQSDYAIEDSDAVAVAVLAVTKLSLVLDQKPDFAIAGQEYNATARLLNQSNAAVKLRFTAKSGDALARVEPSEAAVPAGDSQLIRLTSKTDERASRSRSQALQVSAIGADDKTGAVAAELCIMVDIIPRATTDIDLHHYIPATLTMNAAGGRDGTGLQAEVSGAGTLDDTGKRHVSFLARPSSLQSTSSFGERDEYRLDYSDGNLEASLGDQTYGLSSLTDSCHYGRGFGLACRPSALTGVGAYYLQSRWESPGLAETGVYLSRRLSDRAELKVNLLTKSREECPLADRHTERVVSLEGTLRPWDGTCLRFEVGRSGTDLVGGCTDSAYRIQWDGKIGKHSYYSLAKTHAGPDYLGYSRDSDYTNSSLTFPIGDRVQGHVSCGSWRQNLDLRRNRNDASDESLFQAGLNYGAPAGRYLALDYDSSRRTDLLAPADFDFRERALLLTLGRSAGRSTWRAELRSGVQHDLLHHCTSHVRQFNLFASYKASSAWGFTAYGGIGNDAALSGSRLVSNSNNLGLTASWTPGPRSALELCYLKYGFWSDPGTTNQFSLRAHYALPGGQLWSLQAQSNLDAGGGGTSYGLTYSIPFQIPVGIQTTRGGIRGRVQDAGAPPGRGIAKAVLTAGGTAAISDDKGDFVFPALPPGTYSVSVDRRSVGLDRVVTAKLPLQVEVQAGKISFVEIGVALAGTVKGAVLVMPQPTVNNDAGGAYVVGSPGPTDDAAQPRGLGNALVELSNGQEVLRRTTDHNGEFLFESLQPGRWHLKVYDYNLPEYHRLEAPEVDVDVAPAASKGVSFRVVPVLRRIQMLDSSDDEPLRPAPPKTRGDASGKGPSGEGNRPG